MKNAFMVAAVLLLAAACSPEVPATPTYAKDVQPILDAHCVRCHGANDMLNALPEAQHLLAPQPQICYFQRFDNEGDCTTTTSTTCKHAANFCAGMIKGRITLPEGTRTLMPPPPSDRLNDWEQDVLIRWGANPMP
jgi:hypothetical protein